MIKDTYEKNKKEIDIVSVGLVTKTKIQEDKKTLMDIYQHLYYAFKTKRSVGQLVIVL